ncbi:MAG: PH domain-containing protein [Methanosarcinales archaeon Met12]|nr:MAG: PH domain-containing protein [Methanosarcinales archaeon Met12]
MSQIKDLRTPSNSSELVGFDLVGVSSVTSDIYVRSDRGFLQGRINGKINMWELEQHLQKDEKIEYEGTPEWIGYFWKFCLGIITIPLLIGVLIIGWVIIQKLSTKYAITDKRVMDRYGVISEDFKSASFKHITSVRTKQGIIGKMFNFGDIIIDTAGSGIVFEFVWKYVKNPIQVKNQIEKHID